MRLRAIALASALVGALFMEAAASPGRVLTFAERVDAQRAIERVYYSHQERATQPFETTVPRALLKAKVRNTLQQSAALDQYWHSPVTAEALKRELERIAWDTRFPDRLREIYAALDYDSFKIQECFARASLVDRLIRSFFARDERIHADERVEAEALRDEVSHAGPDADLQNPRLGVIEGVIAENEERAGSSGGVPPALQGPPGPSGKVTRRAMTTDEFRNWRAQAPERVGEVSRVLEEGDRSLTGVSIAGGSMIR